MNINFSNLSQMTELLSDSNYYHQLVQFSNLVPGSFGLYDHKSHLILLNDNGLETINMTRDKSIGVTYSDYKCAASSLAGQFIERDKAILSGQKSLQSLSWQKSGKANQWVMMIGEKQPILGKDNKIIGISGQFIDVSDMFIKSIHKLFILSGLDYYASFKRQFEFQITTKYENQILGKRHTEILFLLLRGKISKEIALILNLSPRTVESYIEDMKIKLKCSSRSELLDAGINMGYLGILPESLLAIVKLA